MSNNPIDIDEFEERTDTEQIVLLLDKRTRMMTRRGRRKAKTATIAEQLRLDTNAVSAVLSRLEEQSLVRHKRPY